MSLSSLLATLGMTALFAPVLLAQSQVRAGATKSTDTVTIGEPFEIRVRVRAPTDATIRFPDNPDSTGTVQARDPRTIVTTDSIQTLDQTAIYRVAAWDVGRQLARFPDVVVTLLSPTREVRRVPVGSVEVFVRSVLPADSALRVPKPARPLWETKAFPWWILALVAAAIALGLLLWWWIRHRRKPRPVIVVDPYVRALKEFTRLEAMGLIDAGERTRFVALAVEVLRDYLLARYPDASLALTSRELVGISRRHSHVPVEQLSRVLHEADLAKFARWSLTEDRARQLEREARAIVEREHKASLPRPPLHEAA